MKGYMVLRLSKHIELTDIYGKKGSGSVVHGDIIGFAPIFKTKKAAEKNAKGKYGIVRLYFSEVE